MAQTKNIKELETITANSAKILAMSPDGTVGYVSGVFNSSGNLVEVANLEIPDSTDIESRLVDLETAKDDLNSKVNDLESLKEQIQSNKTEITSLDSMVESLTSDVEEHGNKFTEIEESINGKVSKEELGSLSEKVNGIDERVKELEEVDLMADIEEAKSEASEAKKNADSALALASKVDDIDLDGYAKKDEIPDLAEIEEELSELTKKLAANTENVNELKDYIGDVNGAISLATALQSKVSTEDFESFKSGLEDQYVKATELNDAIFNQVTTQLTELQTSIEEQIKNATDKIDGISIDIEGLKQQVAALEGIVFPGDGQDQNS